MMKLSKAVLPFIAVLVIDVAIVSALPQLSLWLPHLFAGG